MASYEKHFVAFIDFLGFREALRDRARADVILGLLQKLAAFSGDFYAESNEVENGRQSRVRPAISAFSDNIVISYRIGELEKHGISAFAAVCFLQTIVAYIAWNAFEARLLIRGGVAVGLADGSVSFVNDTINLAVWQALGSINGSAVADPGAAETSPLQYMQ